MSQSTVIAAGLLGAFVLYLAMNNRLATYLDILLGRAGANAFGGANPTGGPSQLLTPPASPPGSLIPPNFPYMAPIPGGQ